MKNILIISISFMFAMSGMAQFTKTVTTEVNANMITYIYELIPSYEFPNVHSNAYYYIRNKANMCQVKNSGVWTEYYPRPKLQTDSSVFYQTMLEVFGGLNLMIPMNHQRIHVSFFVGMDGKVKEVTFVIDSTSVFTQYQLESLETKIKERFTYSYKKDYIGFDRANYIPNDMWIFPGRIAVQIKKIAGKCDPTAPNYDVVQCEQSQCDVNSPNYNQAACAAQTSFCDPASPNYNAAACDRGRCNTASPNYNAVACEQSYCNASSPNYDAKVCEKSRCNVSSPNYDAIACAKSRCDVNSPNYDAKACEISRCDASSPNYDAVVCEKSRCNVSSPNYNFVICDQSICNTASPNYDAVGCEKSKCNVSSPNYDALACEKSHCDVNSPNFNVVACEQSRCRVNSPNYDPAQCDPATVDTFVAAYFTFSDLLGHSVNGNNLTLQEGATITDGKLVLTGGTPSNLTQPHVTVVNSPSLNPQTITVAARIKPDAFEGCGNDAIVQKPFTSHAAPYYQYSLGIIGSYGYGSHDLTFGFSGSVNGQYDGLNSYPVNWTPGVWYTVVGIYDGTNFKLYVNGTLAGTKAHAGTLDSFNTDVFIGKLGNSDYSIPATYEWVKIFNRALSDAEVSALGGK